MQRHPSQLHIPWASLLLGKLLLDLMCICELLLSFGFLNWCFGALWLFRDWSIQVLNYDQGTRNAVTCLDDSNSDCEFEDGLYRPRPPNLGGRASSFHSKREQWGRPVMAGMRCWWITSSKGRRRSSILEMVLQTYVHLLVMPWINAVNTAWGWLSAI